MNQTDTRLANALAELKSIREEAQRQTGHNVFTLGDVLARYGGASKPFEWEYADGRRAIQYEATARRDGLMVGSNGTEPHLGSRFQRLHGQAPGCCIEHHRITDLLQGRVLS